MDDLRDLEARLVAGYWMILWADCMRARSGGGEMYVKGSPVAKEFRPKDDPDPMCFVFLQVETCLGTHDSLNWNLAKHVWFDRRPIETFTHSELAGKGKTLLYSRRNKLMVRLAAQIRQRFPEAINPDAIAAARTQARSREMKKCA